MRFEKFGHIDEATNISQGRALFLDIDDHKTPRPSRKYIRWIVEGLLRLHIETIYYKKTKRGQHVIIRIAETLRPLELVALQSILGSDSMREALNFMRARGGVEELPDGDYWLTRWNIIYDFKVE